MSASLDREGCCPSLCFGSRDVLVALSRKPIIAEIEIFSGEQWVANGRRASIAKAGKRGIPSRYSCHIEAQGLVHDLNSVACHSELCIALLVPVEVDMTDQVTEETDDCKEVVPSVELDSAGIPHCHEEDHP